MDLFSTSDYLCSISIIKAKVSDCLCMFVTHSRKKY